MLLTPCLCASLVLILPTLVSLLLKHSFQTIVLFGWGRVPMVELLLFWSLIYSFDLCRTLHALNVISLCVLCILYLFIFIVSVLILLLCFCFCVCKNLKPHKKWKIQKVWSYIFEHISHVSLALYLRTNGFMHLRA